MTLGPGVRAWGPRVLTALLVGSAALPLWAGHWLPLLDLPQHLGLAAVIHHYGDAAWDFQRFYQLDLRPLPYWGFYLPVHLLAYLMPVEAAGRVVLSLYAVGMPLGLASVLTAFGRDRRLAVLGVALAWNTNLFMGFTSFAVALPLWLFALAAAERWLSAPEGEGARRRALAAGGLALGTYLAHGQAFLLLLVAVGLLWLAHRPRGRSLLPFLPSAGLLAYWVTAVVAAPAEEVAAGEHLSVLGALGVPGRIRWHAPGQSLSKLGEALFDVYPGGVEDGLFLGLFAVLAVLVVTRSRPTLDPARGRIAWLHAWRLELLGGGLLFAYFVAPMEIGLQWYVSPRHLVFAALLAPGLVGAGPLVGGRRWLLVPLSVLAVSVPLHAASKVRDFQREVGGFHEIIELSSRGGRTLGLAFDNGAGRPVRTWPLLHFAAYLQLHRGGDLGFSFAGLPSIPVRYRPGQQAPHPYEWRPEQFRWAVHGSHYQRFLVRGDARGDAARLGQWTREVARTDGWILYESGPPEER